MDAGKLMHRMTLQRPVDVQDAVSGAMVRTWADVTGLWAAIEYLSARDLLAAQAQQSQVVARIVIRFRAGVTDDMRLLHGGKVFDIAGVLPDRKTGREYLTLPCSEGLTSG